MNNLGNLVNWSHRVTLVLKIYRPIFNNLHTFGVEQQSLTSHKTFFLLFYSIFLAKPPSVLSTYKLNLTSLST